MRVCKGIAAALNYLQTALSQPVVHGNVTSSSILLGAHSEAKLSDFGHAFELQEAFTDREVHDLGCVIGGFREAPPSAVCNFTAVDSMWPYIAPEASEGPLSPKVDVYSFGMVRYRVVSFARLLYLCEVYSAFVCSVSNGTPDLRSSNVDCRYDRYYMRWALVFLYT